MSDDDIQLAADMLKRLEPGILPYPIFEQVARLVALPVVEFIPLRMTQDGSVEVLLITRPPDDPFWPNMPHTPGTIVRATDTHHGSQDDPMAFARIMHDELLDTSASAPHYVGSIFHDSKRGTEQAQLYWIEVLAEPNVGTFYNVDSLPEQLIESQLEFIRRATQSFGSHKQANK